MLINKNYLIIQSGNSAFLCSSKNSDRFLGISFAPYRIEASWFLWGVKLLACEGIFWIEWLRWYLAGELLPDLGRNVARLMFSDSSDSCVKENDGIYFEAFWALGLLKSFF